MADRVPSGHPSVTTVRAGIARRGGTRRVELRLSGDFPAGEVVRLVIDGRERHARIEDRGDGLAIPGAFDSPRLAREAGTGADRLDEWLRESGLDAGRSALVDVVVPGFRYGVRAPGEEAVYDASEPPDRSLRDIAADLDGAGVDG